MHRMSRQVTINVTARPATVLHAHIVVVNINYYKLHPVNMFTV